MAAFIRYVREAYPPKSNFATSDIPDLTGKVVIVTGANTGAPQTLASFLGTSAKHDNNSGVGKETVKASQKLHIPYIPD